MVSCKLCADNGAFQMAVEDAWLDCSNKTKMTKTEDLQTVSGFAAPMLDLRYRLLACWHLNQPTTMLGIVY